MNINIISEQLDDNCLWITDIINGIVKEAVKKALNIVMIQEPNFRKERFSFDEDCPRQLALVVGYTVPWIKQTIEKLININIEPVLVSVYNIDISHQISSVTFDTAEAMERLTSYLINLGRKNIALFALHRDTIGDLAKLKSYVSTLKKYDIKFDKRDLYFRGTMFDCINSLMQNINRYDAIICPNDLVAVKLTEYLVNKTPDLLQSNKIFITGFGNWKLVETYRPGITRMYTNLIELGCQAVRLHQFLLFNANVFCATATVASELQIRDTTANLNPLICKSEAFDMTYQAPVYSSDPIVMELLLVERFIRSIDEIDIDILKRLCSQLSYAVIAEECNVSENTVKYRIRKMLRITDFDNTTELVVYVKRYHIV